MFQRLKIFILIDIMRLILYFKLARFWLDTLSDFVSESTYNSILNKLIPGYSDNPNLSSNYTIGGRLQYYADAVLAFSNAVQNQIYNQYVSYFQVISRP